MPNICDTLPYPKREQIIYLVIQVADDVGSQNHKKLCRLLPDVLQCIRDFAAQHTDLDTKIHVLTYGETARWVTAQPTLVSEFHWPAMSCGFYRSSLSAALTQLDAHLHINFAYDTPACFPIIFYLGTNYPTDNFFPGLSILSKNRYYSRASKIVVPIESNLDPLLSHLAHKDAIISPQNVTQMIPKLLRAIEIPREPFADHSSLFTPSEFPLADDEEDVKIGPDSDPTASQSILTAFETKNDGWDDESGWDDKSGWD